MWALRHLGLVARIRLIGDAATGLAAGGRGHLVRAPVLALLEVGLLLCSRVPLGVDRPPTTRVRAIVLPVVLARGTVAAADGGGAAGSGALSRQLEAIAEVNAIATVSRFIASLGDTR